MVSKNSTAPTSAQLRAARAMLSLSQDQLAHLSGTSRRTIVSIESDVALVTPETLRAVTMALGDLGIVMIDDDEFIGIRKATL